MASEEGETWQKKLMIEIKRGVPDSVAELLHEGHDINRVCEDEGMSPLSLACQFGHVEVAKLLLDHGADVNLSGSCMIKRMDSCCDILNIIFLTIIMMEKKTSDST